MVAAMITTIATATPIPILALALRLDGEPPDGAAEVAVEVAVEVADCDMLLTAPEGNDKSEESTDEAL